MVMLIFWRSHRVLRHHVPVAAVFAKAEDRCEVLVHEDPAPKRPPKDQLRQGETSFSKSEIGLKLGLD
jgi:hypothetical protein